MGNANKVGVLGASSLVGQALSPLLVAEGFQVFAFSRQLASQSDKAVSPKRFPRADQEQTGLSDIAYSKPITGNVHWWPLSTIERVSNQESIAYWICLAPIWVVSDYFKVFQANHAKRIVVLSSTSRFSKQHSSESDEQVLAKRLEDSESDIQLWAEKVGIEWVILRPTLIYGLGRDRNICEIIRLIRRFGFFPLLGEAKGLRQPVHCNDVAQASMSALCAANAGNKCYNLSGLDALSYKDMIIRVFAGLNKAPRFFKVPLSILKMMLGLLRLLPRYRRWKFSMVERMNQDLIFDHQEAACDLAFKPRPFHLTSEDLP